MEDSPQHGLMRDVIAFLVVVLACPVAVWGGSMLGCVGQPGRFTACAMNAFFIGPPMLMVAGFIAGTSSRGWTGLFITGLATLLGMLSILLLAMAVGRPVPIDWFSAVVSTMWFAGPIVIGYGVARLVARIRRRFGRRTRA
jgi:hypothetical protein